ncbi:Autotransporter-associated beta strand repeat protein [Pseudobythopirellula maris]|uniref:Autotransporter-associated beta strand repeat protein n=1 Tax=Pseudobythopirellula maris TaxID=2527991 RepID=A0A5C5ZVH4_9BACT|nr:autotransporter-associated beta strand repeat-containing protein [Pseudobythopirellula maris]TWT90941.1 Autotransporter-associated beta strand repeat protein [Pseudobythopirellula maris]
MLLSTTAVAQLAESNWDSSLTGSQDWQVDANWSTPTFPNDPDRMDPDMTVFTPVIGANLSVGLGADLNVNVGATDVAVAGLRMGGSAGPVSTTVSSSGGRLVFENYELPDTTDEDDVIQPWNSGRALLVSGGSAGSTNEISAPVQFNDIVDVGTYDDGVTKFRTTKDLTLSGQLTFSGNSSINALSSNSIYVTGPVVTEAAPTTENPDATTTARFNANSDSRGTVHLQSVISGPGTLRVGGGGGTTIISAANTVSNFSYGSGTLVLANDQAMGLDTRIGSGGLGAAITSDNDARTVSASMVLSNYPLVAGDHSLTWLGDITQRNSRGWVNHIAKGKTFNIAGTIAADEDPPEDIPNEREFYFDGTGDWNISGKMVNRLDSEDYPLPENDQPQSFGLRGIGSVHVTGTDNTYSAYTRIQGGNWHYATNDAMSPAVIQATGGGTIGVDTGTIYVGGNPANVNTDFLIRLNNRSQQTATFMDDVESFMDYDTGGLMLSSHETDADFDFTSGMLRNAESMSLSGPAEGITYTGSVTPADSTYRFGGGTGVITLPGTNQLTGNNKLLATNGLDSGSVSGLGGVRITGVNDYTGETRIQGKYLRSLSSSAGGVGMANNSYNGTTLIVTEMANGGVSSSIGASSSSADNLVIQGSTLRYEGDGDTTDRLFTIGTHGATLDSSGSGAIVFNNTGALKIMTASDRVGTVSNAFDHETGITQSGEWIPFGFEDTSDLVRGMIVSEDGNHMEESELDDDDIITVTGIQSPTRFVISDQQNLFVNYEETPSTWSFIDVQRTFTLTGDNTGDNTLASVIGDSVTNLVNLEKEGSGKWILTAPNTYTGDTSVDEGILSITNAYLADTADVRVDDNAVFDLDFAGIDTVSSLFLDDASVPAGTYGAFGTGADYESDYFSGTGILEVTLQIETRVAGDYNNNGVVDAADFTVFRDNLGAAEGTLINDFLGGVVGAVHYDQWVENFGSTEVVPIEMPEMSVAVPEPAAVALGLIALLSVCFGRGAKK